MASLLIPPNVEQLKNIKKELKEDDEKMKHYVKLFYDWLKCEQHLPKDVDARLVENYIRLCKNDLQKAKDKFEQFIISTGKHEKYYNNHGRLDHNFFSPYKFHRVGVILPRLTPDGYRIMSIQIEDTDITNFNIETIIKYMYLTGTYLFYNDVNGGFVYIMDFRNVGVHFLPKLDLMAVRACAEICFSILPIRLSAIHVINLPAFADVLFKWALNLLKEKLRKRVVLHKSVDGLLDHFDRDLLPEELGGSLKSVYEIGEDWKASLMRSDEYLKELEKLKLTGPIPKNKLNGPYNCDMEGSFRKLVID